MNNSKHIVIIGGGAAGLVAAISAARVGAHVTLLEGGKRVGSKILKTGNGRCNLTNMHVDPADYNHPGFVAPIIDEWPAARVLDFFETLGMLSVEESEGRVYPLSNSANTVLDVLRFECERLGVETLCEHAACEIYPGKNSREFTVTCANGESFAADRVIVTTGGGTDTLHGLGHAMTPFRPVLCSLKTSIKSLKGLSGVRAHAIVRAYHENGVPAFAATHPANSVTPFAELSGEVLFRDYGLSGIVIFDMSRLVQAGDWLSLDLVSHMECNALESWLTSRYDSMRKCAGGKSMNAPAYSELMCGILHARLNNAVVRAAGCKPSELVSREKLSAIASAAKDFRVQVEGTGDPKQAQVTRGGASVEEFNPITLESRLHPGLYVAGEALDVDGRCGGFNLHWAWASGVTAGMEASGS